MVQKFCDEPCDEVPHGSRLRPTDFLLRPTEKKFHWSRRGIATNGIFAASNAIKKKAGRSLHSGARQTNQKSEQNFILQLRFCSYL
jgi:hypothetical protein